MNREHSINLFKKCEAARREALDAGKDQEEAHEAAKKIWNRWARLLLDERTNFKQAGTWDQNKKDWENRASITFTQCDFQIANLQKVVSYKYENIEHQQEVLTVCIQGDYLNFSDYIFPSFADFENITFSGDTDFQNSTFSCEANFANVTFSGNAYFQSATFSGNADFQNTRFKSDANFMDATFFGHSDFMDATFSGDTIFLDVKFSSNTIFQDATFLSRALFTKAIFSDRSDFMYVTFSGHTSFRSTVFSDKTSFIEVTFSGDAKFDGATFSGNTEFQSVTFSDDVDFQNATFSADTDFDRAIFSRGVNFWRATFLGDIKFESATFSGDTDFQNSTFSGDANFASVTFSDTAHFQSVTFSAFAGFKSAIFSGNASFTALASKSAFDLSDVAFSQVPNFHQADFTQAPNLANVTVPIVSLWKSVFSKLDKDEISKFRALRRLAIDGHDHERERYFFKGEMRYKRGTEEKWWQVQKPIWWLSLLYDALSDYGTAVLRPLTLWILMVPFIAWVYWKTSPIQQDISNSNCQVWDVFWSSINLAVQNTLIFFAAIRKSELRQSYECLFPNGDFPYYIPLIGFAHTFFSAILLFLILLGLRNMFKIK